MCFFPADPRLKGLCSEVETDEIDRDWGSAHHLNTGEGHQPEVTARSECFVGRQKLGELCLALEEVVDSQPWVFGLGRSHRGG